MMKPLEIRMEIKRLILEARKEKDYSDFDWVGEVDELDIQIEAAIRPDLFEVAVRNKR